MGLKEVFSDYTVSIHYDRRLYKQDIAGSKAHARMLSSQGIISGSDADAIVAGLNDIQEEISSGKFAWKPELEDIHMNIERRLFELIGEPALRLHTARSRNDQVALDVRMYAKEAMEPGVPGGTVFRRSHARLHACPARPAGLGGSPPARLLRDVLPRFGAFQAGLRTH